MYGWPVADPALLVSLAGAALAGAAVAATLHQRQQRLNRAFFGSFTGDARFRTEPGPSGGTQLVLDDSGGLTVRLEPGASGGGAPGHVWRVWVSGMPTGETVSFPPGKAPEGRWSGLASALAALHDDDAPLARACHLRAEGVLYVEVVRRGLVPVDAKAAMERAQRLGRAVVEVGARAPLGGEAVGGEAVGAPSGASVGAPTRVG